MAFHLVARDGSCNYGWDVEDLCNGKVAAKRTSRPVFDKG